MIQFRSEGIILDVQPDQDVTFTLDNPIFEDDRVPVAVSTNVEFKLSPKNCKFFGFTPGIRRRPSRKTAACEALFNGIVAFQGELKYDDYSDKSLQYSFVGAEFDHIVTGKLTDIPFSGFEDIKFSTMVENARKGLYDEFGLPQIMRKAMSASIEYVTSGPTKAECSTVDKYANWLYTTRPYVVPAIKVRYILDKILPELELGEPELEKLLNMLAILGLYKSSEYDNRYGVKDTSPGAGRGYILPNVRSILPTRCRTWT